MPHHGQRAKPQLTARIEFWSGTGLINEYERAAKKPRSGPVAEFRNPKPRYDVEDLACLLRRYRLDPRDLTDLFGGALVVDFGEIGGDEAAVVGFTLCG